MFLLEPVWKPAVAERLTKNLGNLPDFQGFMSVISHREQGIRFLPLLIDSAKKVLFSPMTKDVYECPIDAKLKFNSSGYGKLTVDPQHKLNVRDGLPKSACKTDKR